MEKASGQRSPVFSPQSDNTPDSSPEQTQKPSVPFPYLKPQPILSDQKKKEVSFSLSKQDKKVTERKSIPVTPGLIPAPEFNPALSHWDWNNVCHEQNRFKALGKLTSLDNWSKCKLESGGFSHVYIMRDSEKATEYAVKFLKTTGSKSDLEFMKLKKGEIIGLQISPHPHMVKTHGILLRNIKIKGQPMNQYRLICHPDQIDDNEKDHYLVVAVIEDFIKGKSLLSMMESQSSHFSEELTNNAVITILQLIDALMHMHDNGIVFRDLKPDNVLYETESQTIKLLDFGLSRFIAKNEMADTACGSLAYVAPEAIEHKQYDFSVDSWSLGCLLFEIISGKQPAVAHLNKAQLDNLYALPASVLSRTLSFAKDTADAKKDFLNRISGNFFDAHKELLDIIVQLLEYDPQKRLTLKDAKERLLSITTSGPVADKAKK